MNLWSIDDFLTECVQIRLKLILIDQRYEVIRYFLLDTYEYRVNTELGPANIPFQRNLRVQAITSLVW